MVFCSGKGGGSSPTSAVQNSYSKCQSYSTPLQTVMLKIVGGHHVPDTRVALLTWNFLKKYKRAGAMTALPAAASKEVLSASTTTSSGMCIHSRVGAYTANFSGCRKGLG